MNRRDVLIRAPEGGANQSGLRDRNARLVLSLLRRHGALAGAEIARRSGLSAQTVSNITRALEADGLLRRGAAVKGKVGKPSIPMALEPNGVQSLGLNIGRRSAELALVDFNGRLIDACETTYAFPEIEAVFGFLDHGIARFARTCPRAFQRMAGIGVARPNEIWNWLELVNAPASAMQKWQDLNLEEEVSHRTELEAFIRNDATSACVAEHLLGRGGEFRDFAYIFVGAFVGGGLVLDGKIVWGRTGNTAALGPLPLPGSSQRGTQLLNVASLHVLETALQARGLDIQALRDSADDWSAFEPEVSDWVDETAANLGLAAASIASVVEVQAILLDGAFPAALRARLAEKTAAALADIDLTGVEKPRIEEGSIGRRARSLGAALLPIHSKYFVT
ncbi:MAG: ROK family transcriptional regulator [Pseudomonadota bacterium]